MIKAVYIHIPFCTSICSYCDFCKFFYNEDIVDTYLNSLNREIKKYYNGEIIETIYIGGGTPSSLNIDQLGHLFEILKIFKTENLEYTIECNVGDLDEDKLNLFKRYGLNRLSIGVQSFNEDKLRYLNRNHTKEEALSKIELAKKFFDNISVDLMYAIPGETLEILNSDLDILLELDIQHISTYSLIIEAHTILKNNNEVNVDEDLDCEMYNLIKDKLTAFEHYEISNFGKIKSKHNLVYWNNEEYYGFGVGASGYFHDLRYDNVKSLKSYNNGKYRLHEEHQTEEMKIENEFILGLRKIAGISVKKFYDKYQKEITDVQDVRKLIDEKKLVLDDGQIYIYPDKLYISNEIMLNFIE